MKTKQPKGVRNLVAKHAARRGYGSGAHQKDRGKALRSQAKRTLQQQLGAEAPVDNPAHN